jgi:signal transduction histidine kinase
MTVAAPYDRAPTSPSRPYGVVVFVSVLLLIVATVFILFVPGISFAVRAPDVDLVVNTTATVVAGGVAALAWIRFREADEVHELFQASAFLTLAIGGYLAILLAVSDLGARFGFSLSDPGQVPTYLWIVQRFIAAVLFVIGGWVGQRWVMRTPRKPFLVVLGPAVLLILISMVLLALADSLPRIRDLDSLAAAISSGAQIIDLGHVGSALALLEAAVAVLFVAAAYLFTRTYVRYGQRSVAYLVLGLLVAAIAQVHSLFLPTSYPGLLTSVDIFRILFYAILLLGVAAGARDDLRTLRRANDELRLLRDAAVQAATLQERARLAREIHDGLIQDLWLARLKTGQLVDVARLPQEAEVIGSELADALDTALVEARQALTSLAPPTDPGSSLTSSITRLAGELSVRLDPEIDVDLPAELPWIPATVDAELLRIIGEAVINAGKHADATLVQISARVEAGRFHVVVADNGRGFDAAKPQQGYGLRSMRERAALIDAELTVRSRPLDGTLIEVSVPIEPPSEASGIEGPDRGRTSVAASHPSPS